MYICWFKARSTSLISSCVISEPYETAENLRVFLFDMMAGKSACAVWLLLSLSQAALVDTDPRGECTSADCPSAASYCKPKQ